MLVGGAGLLLARPTLAALPVPDAGHLTFKVTRNGDEIGSHAIAFTQSGDTLTVQVDVALAVKFGPITVYRYTHRDVEVYRGDELQSIETDSDDDGTPFAVRAQRQADGLHVQGTRAQPYIAPADALPSSHWNRKVLDGSWINTQDGRLVRPQIKALGRGPITTAEGQVQCDGFEITAPEVEMSSWYDGQAWCGVDFKGKDGSQINYIRL